MEAVVLDHVVAEIEAGQGLGVDAEVIGDVPEPHSTDAVVGQAQRPAVDVRFEVLRHQSAMPNSSRTSCPLDCLPGDPPCGPGTMDSYIPSLSPSPSSLPLDHPPLNEVQMGRSTVAVREARASVLVQKAAANSSSDGEGTAVEGGGTAEGAAMGQGCRGGGRGAEEGGGQCPGPPLRQGTDHPGRLRPDWTWGFQTTTTDSVQDRSSEACHTAQTPPR